MGPYADTLLNLLERLKKLEKDLIELYPNASASALVSGEGGPCSLEVFRSPGQPQVRDKKCLLELTRKEIDQLTGELDTR